MLGDPQLGLLLGESLGCCYQGMWGGRGGTGKARTGSCCRQGFAQLSSSLSSRSLPARADAPALLSCARGRDIGSTSNPSPPRRWAVSRPPRLSSVQGEPLPAPGPAFPCSCNSQETVWRGVKNKTAVFCSRRAPLPHPPTGPGSQSKVFGGSPLPLTVAASLGCLMKWVQGDKSLPCVLEVTFVPREGCLSPRGDMWSSVAPADAGCCWDPEELSRQRENGGDDT